MLLLNLLVVTVSVWIIFVVNYKFIQPALKNRQRFKLYKLRDELSILAMQGVLDEHSDEYLTLMEVQNASISASRSFMVTDFLRFLLRFHKDKEMQKRISVVMDNLDKTDNAEYCRIASDSFNVMHSIMRRDTRVLRYAFFPVLVLLGSILAVLRCTKPKEKIEKKKGIIEDIDKDLDCLSNGFGGGCPA